MRASVVVITCLTLASPAASDECPPEIRRVLEDCHKRRLELIGGWDKTLPTAFAQIRQVAAARVGKRKAPGTFPTAQARDMEAAKLKRALMESYVGLLELREGTEVRLPIIASLNVGQVGTLTSLHIEQIIDGTNALVSFEDFPPGTPGWLIRSGEGLVKHTFWLQGIPTANLADDDDVNVKGRCFRVIGNKTYGTAIGGSRTVMLVEALDADTIDKFYRPVPIPEFVERKWQSASGDELGTAALVEFSNGTVQLKTDGGQVLTLSAAKLSSPDRHYLRQYAAPRLEIRKMIAQNFPQLWLELKDRLAKLDATTADARNADFIVSSGSARAVSIVAPEVSRLPSDGGIVPEEQTDERNQWQNESYNSALRRVKGNAWQHIDNKTGQVLWNGKETASTSEYIELLSERNEQLRVMAKRMELYKDGKWGWVANGHWEAAPNADHDASATSSSETSNPSNDDSRDRWINKTYNTTVRYVKGRKVWEEVDNKTGRVNWVDKEIARTADYIELFSPERKSEIRLRAERMEQKLDGEWKWVANGQWGTTPE